MKITCDKNDPYRFLCNNAKYGFTLEEHYWPSVIHFIEAKKFEGTAHEENIKKSRTSLQVSKRSRGRNVLVAKLNDLDNTLTYEKDFFYGGKKAGYKIKSDWNEVKFSLLEQALQEKFKQHHILRKLLLSTSPNKFRISSDHDGSDYVRTNSVVNRISSDYVRTGSELKYDEEKQLNKKTTQFLLKLRDQLLFSEMKLLTSKSLKTTKTLSSNQLKDLNPEFLSYNSCFDIANVLIQLSYYIASMEGWDVVYPEMVEDAIYNIYNRKGKCYLPKTKIDAEKQPNTFKMAKKVEKEFTGYKFGKSSSSAKNISNKDENTSIFDENIVKASEKIAKYILWCTLAKNRLYFVYSKLKKYFVCKDEFGNINFRKFEIVIPPSKREYRKLQPPKIKKNHS
jgi:predicted NAD-dependent protein-ADP-ribosyltransferase YbiA (DUF1768 family)